MGYDCSVTKRKGCNYCLKSKNIGTDIRRAYIDDETKTIETIELKININYCPICGKKLRE